MAVKEIKDWTKDIEGIADMDTAALTNLYSEMLATAHDLGYKVPDNLLIETENPEELRPVLAPLHEGIKAHHAELAKQPTKPAREKKAAAKLAVVEKTPKKAAKKASQKGTKEKTMAKAAKTVAEPKAAKKVNAKKAAKKAAKKGSTANARTAVARFTGDEIITVKVKENPAREGSGKFDRMKNLMKFGGKKVGAFLKTELGRSSTLHNAVKAGYISIK